MPCHSELNSQIKGLQARIEQAEHDINAHYVGISQLAMSLAANPFTAGSAAMTAAIYNLQPIGMHILRALLHALIPKEIENTMRMMTMLSAVSIDDLAEGIVDSAAAQVVGAVNQGIDMITQTALGELASIQNELNNLVPSIANGIVSQLNGIAINNDRTLKESLAQQAYDAWYNASIAPIGEITAEALTALRVTYLQAQQAIHMIDAGIFGSISQAKHLLDGVAPTIQEINNVLQQVNSIAGFILTQNNISSCKSIKMTIGTKT